MNNKLSLLVNFIGIDKLSGSMRNIVGLGKTGGQVLRGMKDDARRLERELMGVQRAIAAGAGNVTGLVNREKELKTSIAAANAQLEKQKTLLAINAKADAIRAKGEDLKSRGTANIMAGASIAAPFILATKAAADFSSGMVDIQQKAGLSNRQTEQLKNNIILAAAAAKKMPEELRAGVDLLLGMGMDVKSAMAITPSIGRLGTAFKVDLADGAAAAYANVNNLKIGVNDIGKSLDIMAASANQGGFEVRDMARFFPGLTAQMQALGQTGTSAAADLSAALQVAMHTAANADEAGNNILNLLGKITAPVTNTAFEKNFGIDLPVALKKLESQGYSTLEAIAMITEKATGGDMRKIGEAFQDRQASMGILALIQNMKEYRRIRAESLKGGGTIDKAFDQRVLRDANVRWNEFKGTASQLAITLGTTLLPMMTSALQTVNHAALAVSLWAQMHPVAAGYIIKVVGALAAFRLGLGVAQYAIGGLLGPFARLFVVMSRFRAWGGITRIVMGGFAMWQRMAPFFASLGPIAMRAFSLLASGGMMAGRAILFVGRAMLMNPIGLLVTAIAVAAYLIYANWDKIKAAFFSAVAWMSQAWAAIKAAFMTGVTFILSLHGRMVGIGRNIIMGLVNGIKSAGSAVWQTLKNIVMGGINGVKAFLGIKSPSRVFMAIGGHMSKGMALGIGRGGKGVLTAAGKLAAGAAAASALSMSPAGANSRQNAPASLARAAMTPTGANAFRAAVTTPSGPGQPPVNLYVDIRIDGAGKDAKQIAEEVKRELEKLAGTANRRAFDDGE